MPRPNRDVLTQHEVESMILDLSDRLERLTDEYAGVCDTAHETDMDYKHAYHSAIVAAANGPKTTADERKSKAWLAAERKERASGAAQAVKESHREAMRTTTTQIDALRTLAANIRSQT